MEKTVNTQLTKATSKKVLAKEMGISYTTLRRMLQKSGMTIPRGSISPEQRLQVLKKLGWHEKE